VTNILDKPLRYAGSAEIRLPENGGAVFPEILDGGAVRTCS
jgi:hypothetical protein